MILYDGFVLESWFCPKCIAKELAATPDAYGFEDTRTAYTLQTFGSMAEDFKRHYFRKPFQVRSFFFFQFNLF